MTILLAASLFFTNPAPMEMPRAQAFLVKERAERKARQTMRLEDRFDRTDLWISRSVDGMWRDDDGREFMLATLGTIAPPLTGDRSVTREDYVASSAPLLRKGEKELFTAIDKLSPVAPTEEYACPHQTPRGYRDVRYYQGTNETAIVCAFIQEKSERWYLASWTLAQGDSYDDCVKIFEGEFLEKRDTWPKGWAEEPKEKKGRVKDPPPPGERELLRADARHSVALYGNWRVTDGDEFTVLDDIQNSRAFTVALTNDLKQMRGAYAAVMPSPIDGSNVLAVARIFASREEYLDALGQNDHGDMEWSAAYWSPQRRELVAYLPPDGSDKLIETIRHEAFHQYLFYATGSGRHATWFNEGHACFFENVNYDRKKNFVRIYDDPKDRRPRGVAQDPERIAKLVKEILPLDHAAFYSGTLHEVNDRYTAAWAAVYFLQKGAPTFREFEMYRNVLPTYLKAMQEGRSAQEATELAWEGVKDRDFVADFLKFWGKRGGAAKYEPPAVEKM